MEEIRKAEIQSRRQTEHYSKSVRLKKNLCSGVIVRWERRKQQKIIPLRMLKRKIPKKNGEGAGRMAGVKSLILHVMMCHSTILKRACVS